MNIPQIIIVFFVSWWLVFLPALSIGVQGQHESEEGVVDGTEAGAPVAPMLLKKALWATIGAVVITIAAMIVIPMLAP
ncbi:MAG: DUF1467 family protein [Pseudomonadota bacterium]